MNVIKKAMVSTFLTAATAFGAVGAAEAAPAPNPQACVNLAQSQGVLPYPASRKAVQQQGSLACIFGEGAGGRHFVLHTFNLNDSRQAQSYHRELEQMNRAEDHAIRHNQNQQRQREQEARRNNPVNQLRDSANQARSVIDSINQFRNMGRHLGL